MKRVYTNTIISLVAIVTLITSCNTVTYKYQDRPYLDLDMPVLDFKKMSQQEAEILSEAEVRVGIFERERGTRDYAFNGPYGLTAPNGASVNISERLYDFIWETHIHYYRELSARGGGGIIDTDALLKEPKEDLIYALMHSGNKSKDWSNAEYNKLCRYANKIQKDWKKRGFSLEEMDMLAQRCKGLHRKELVLSQADSMKEFNRSVVLVWSERHQRLYAVNAIRMERRHGKDSDSYLLKAYNFHWNPKYGHRVFFKPEEVKFIYE